MPFLYKLPYKIDIVLHKYDNLLIFKYDMVYDTDIYTIYG